LRLFFRIAEALSIKANHLMSATVYYSAAALL